MDQTSSRSYPDLLEDPTLASQVLRGYLTGSIDAVLRVWSEDQPRYLVVDYKTNWLGALDAETLTIGDYTPARMAEAMMGAHYPLQALLYAVARTPDAALAATRLRSGGAPRRRALPLRPRHGRPGTPRGWAACRVASSAGIRHRHWSSSCPPCSTESRDEHGP